MEKRAENVQKFIAALHGNIDVLIMSRLEECESPIEELFCLALMEELGMLNANPSMQEFSPYNSITFELQEEHLCTDVSDSAKYGKYRVDFLLRKPVSVMVGDKSVYDGEVSLIVECDGWEFHSTKEAISYDNMRDILILNDYGTPTIRFLGKDINENPSKCARIAIETLDELAREETEKLEFVVENMIKLEQFCFVDRLKRKTKSETD